MGLNPSHLSSVAERRKRKRGRLKGQAKETDASMFNPYGPDRDNSGARARSFVQNLRALFFFPHPMRVVGLCPRGDRLRYLSPSSLWQEAYP